MSQLTGSGARDRKMSPIKRKNKGDHVSHKVIEKRRRDRINNCLAELSQSVPAAFTKQTAGKLEKAEILEMTVEYLRAINSLNIGANGSGEWVGECSIGEFQRHFTIGYGECLREVLRYVTEVEGLHFGDLRCSRMITYLQNKGADLMESINRDDKIVSLNPLRHQQLYHDFASTSAYLQWNSLTRLRSTATSGPASCLCCQSTSSAFVTTATASTSKPIPCLACTSSSSSRTEEGAADKLSAETLSYENMYNNYYHNFTSFTVPDFNRHKDS